MFLRAFLFLALGASLLFIFNPRGGGKAETESEFSLSRWFGCKAYWFMDPYEIHFWGREYEAAKQDGAYFGKMFTCGRDVTIMWLAQDFRGNLIPRSPALFFPKRCARVDVMPINKWVKPIEIWQDGERVFGLHPNSYFTIGGEYKAMSRFRCRQAIAVPTGNRIAIKTRSGGQMVIGNFYKHAKDTTYDSYAVIEKTKDYTILYYAEDTSFLIQLQNKNFRRMRGVAEKKFLSFLNISQQQACEISVTLNLDPDLEKRPGYNYGLSFCLWGEDMKG